MYVELPPGLLTSEEATKKYDISMSTIRTWVNRGHLQRDQPGDRANTQLNRPTMCRDIEGRFFICE